MQFFGHRAEVVARRTLHEAQPVFQLLADLEDDVVDVAAHEQFFASLLAA